MPTNTKNKKKTFRRQEYAKHKRLETKWRRPRGKHSKLRKGEKARGKVPSPGFSAPRAVRGLTHRGKEVRISTLSQLTPELKGSYLVIASTVGKRKSLAILSKAEEMGLRIQSKHGKTAKLVTTLK